jgi:hypothetical protein
MGVMVGQRMKQLSLLILMVVVWVPSVLIFMALIPVVLAMTFWILGNQADTVKKNYF